MGTAGQTVHSDEGFCVKRILLTISFLLVCPILRDKFSFPVHRHPRKKWERRNTSLPPKILLAGAEAKRSFAQNSFAYFSFKKSRWERRDTSLPLKILLTGAEAKRSFAQSSLLSGAKIFCPACKFCSQFLSAKFVLIARERHPSWVSFTLSSFP